MIMRKWLLCGASVVAMSLQGAAAQTKGGVLSMIVQPEPPVLVTAINQQGPTQFVAGKIYESLLTYTHDLEPRPGLARSWDISPDGLTYTFHLHTGVKWHDGEDFTADDVVFSLSEMLPETHARARVPLNKYVKAVDKLDDATVRITLNQPFPAFILMFEPGCTPMMPKHIYEGTDYLTNPANQKPIGTGPFVFKEWKRGDHIRLERNPHYWQEGKPYLDALIFNVIPDAASRAVAFEKGIVNVLRGGDVDNVDVKRLSDMPDTERTSAGWEMFSPQSFLIFNLRRPPFDNVKVRQAVMSAMNRQLIVDNIFFGLGRVATGPFAYTEMFYDKNTPEIAFDLNKAKALIKESGIKPAEYTIRMLSFPYGSTWERLDEYTKQTLEGLGFKVNLESTDAGGWASRTGNWDFDLTTTFGYQFGDPALGVERSYITANIVKGSPFANVQGYENPDLDKLWSDAASEVDSGKRQAMYSDIQRELIEDVPLGFLVDMEFPTLYNKKVKNVIQTAIGMNETFADVYIEE